MGGVTVRDVDVSDIFFFARTIVAKRRMKGRQSLFKNWMKEYKNQICPFEWQEDEMSGPRKKERYQPFQSGRLELISRFRFCRRKNSLKRTPHT